jgi:hypothetical protein
MAEIPAKTAGGESRDDSWSPLHAHRLNGDKHVERNLTQENLYRRKRREFETTLTELKAIAPAATIGLRSPNAATGIPITL